MSKNKKIFKIIAISLIVFCILLISPNVLASNLKFNCFGEEFTVTGAGEYDEYALCYDLCNAKKIEDMDNKKDSKNTKKWKVGREITTPSGLGGGDGYHIMRRRKSMGS